MADGMSVAEDQRSDRLDRPVAESDTRAQPARDEARRPGAGTPDGKNASARPPKRSYRRWVVLGILALIVAGGATYYWWSTRGLVTTDDAYTDGFVSSIAAQVSGQVTDLAVDDNQHVHKGDVLFRIDPRPFIDARDKAQANLENTRGQLAAAQYAAEVAEKNFPATLQAAKAQLASAQATLFKAQTDARRQHSLPRAATTQQDVDYADAALRQAQAQVAQAEAQVAEAEPVKQNIGEIQARVTQLDGGVKQAEAELATANLNLEWATVRSPRDGWVTQRTVARGNYVQPGQTVMSIVSDKVWVTANFKETQLTDIRAGQRVTFEVDAYPFLHLTGHVDSIQLGSGSRFSAFPAENATGNFVKIVQRVPVKLVIDSGLDPKLPLPLGISVVPTVHLN
ncbi:efflux RND transporter periplasmic adaptor subunit [Acidisphaera rubrifaciens]|uniref:Multidrug resistance efflux pump HlyD n=1 Tax=Acidisphaera rubrifaciens HS-AP3 TaxID=1231350 RepID=A0A0D6P6E0_9PROT|nr:efflux RND transporter periplasmic adaptor subunit [Acidisphaera rubrifaciens]GAN76444.1 multidrug resistance efflux pump HlyD [Acidisphaera rubrifaciens HS-AP3]